MNDAKDRIGLEFISVLGMPPVEFVGVAADLGCRHIGIGLEPIVRFADAYPEWSLRDDPGLRRELVAALKDRGVSISLGEGFIASPTGDIRTADADIAMMAELGVATVNMLVFDADRNRAVEQCAIFADMAAAREMKATLEFLPNMSPATDLEQAVGIVRDVERANFGVLIDTMHLFRSGASVADLAAVDPARIGYVQLCDVPLMSRYANYADEARYDRLAPGEGELPLKDLLSVLPADVTIGLEVPMMAKAQAGIGPRDRLAGAVAAARRLITVR